MSVIVVAVLSVKPGRGKDVIDAFREVTPLVHAEPGCEMYAAHLQKDGDNVVMVERWASTAELRAHSAGPAIAQLNELNADNLLKAPVVWVVDPVAMGDEIEGVIPSA